LLHPATDCYGVFNRFNTVFIYSFLSSLFNSYPNRIGTHKKLTKNGETKMENLGTSVFALLIALTIVAVIFLVCRELMCWYWKINRTIELLEKIEANTNTNKQNIVVPDMPRDSNDGV
jgi:hypothetical protein